MTDFTQEQKLAAQEAISAHVNNARSSLGEAEKIADEYGICISWDLAYGMGGHYEPKGQEKYDYWGESSSIREEGEWVSSSAHC